MSHSIGKWKDMDHPLWNWELHIILILGDPGAVSGVIGIFVGKSLL